MAPGTHGPPEMAKDTVNDDDDSHAILCSRPGRNQGLLREGRHSLPTPGYLELILARYLEIAIQGPYSGVFVGGRPALWGDPLSQKGLGLNPSSAVTSCVCFGVTSLGRAPLYSSVNEAVLRTEGSNT